MKEGPEKQIGQSEALDEKSPMTLMDQKEASTSKVEEIPTQGEEKVPPHDSEIAPT